MSPISTPKPFKIEEIDLTKVTRPGMVTSIIVGPRWERKKWITCGLVNISKSGESVELAARAGYGITDFEHDSAYIFRIPLLYVNFEFIDSGRMYFNGMIGGDDPKDLRVPDSGAYDPYKLEGATRCTHCKGEEKGHLIVPEGYWSGPPANPAAWKALFGQRIEISMYVRTGGGEEE